jgi:IclR family acetate operon transcriptional repressor
MTNGKVTGGAGARVVRVLQCVAQEQGEFTLRPLAKRLQLPPTTVHRLLQILVKSDMIERTDADAYRPGRELYRMASRLVQRFDVQTIARPTLLELWTEWQETCSICLYVPSERIAKVADTIPSPHPLRYVLEISSTFALAWGSLGHSILAYLSDSDVDEILSQSRRGPLTGAPAPSRAELRRELSAIRRRRYAVYENRTVLNIAGMAAPFFGPTGSVMGCVGIMMPASRSKIRDRRLGAAIVLAAERVTTALGGELPVRERRPKAR